LKLYVVTNGNWNATKPLIGSGLLVVLGDCNVPAGSNYQGFIYCEGDYTQEGPSLVSGAVMVKGTVTIFGAGDTAEVDYDFNMMNQVQAEMIQYRFGRNPYLYVAN
jgi:formylmethanofuran dehydrogenase subunit C